MRNGIIILLGVILGTSLARAKTEEVVIHLTKDSNGNYIEISEEEYNRKERRNFSFSYIDTEEALRKVADAFGKKILIYDKLGNSKCSIDLSDVTLEEVYENLLEPIGYEYKEFEGGILVIKQTCNSEKEKT